MNIKQIVKSQTLRHKLMRLGKFIPDSLMISLQYLILHGRLPNLSKPQRFTEWIQWYKINYRDPLMLQCVDKYSVREYVSQLIGNRYLTQLYHKCSDANEIDFNKLPDKFVIKTTSGGNGDNVLIVKDKTKLNISETIEKVNGWRKKNYSDTSREWAYKKAAEKPEIIVEEYIEHNETKGLDDYKFFCFNGKCQFFKIDFNRFIHHQANYYDQRGRLIDVTEGSFESDPTHDIVPSLELKKMIEIAETLSKSFPFVRVDLYCENNKIYFGELTFYPGSGYFRFSPDSFDVKAGTYFNLSPESEYTKFLK